MTPSRFAGRSRAPERALWLVVAAQYVYCLWSYDGLTMGDGFIVARYAENLVDHGELAFNLGERIWSFTSPLHTLLVAGYYAITGASIPTNQVVSIGCVLGAFALVSRYVCRNALERLFAAIVILLSPCLIFWTTAGLETAHLALVVAALVAAMFHSHEGRPGAGYVALVTSLAALAFLCRYDASLFALPAVLAAYRRAGIRVETLAAALPAVALVAGWAVFAFAYYGELFPTSFYAKRPSFRTDMLQNAIYEAQFVVVSALPWVVAAGLALRRGAQLPSAAKGEPAPFSGAAWLFVGLLLTFAYGLGAATKHMMFAYRLLVPYLPALLAAALVLSRSRAAARPGGARVGRGLALAFCAAAMGCQGIVQVVLHDVGVNPSFVGEFTRFSAVRMQRFSNEIWEPLADDLRRHWARQDEAGERAPRLYTWEAGQVPYRMRALHVYDNGLISWRHRCDFSSMASADYILIWPGNPRPPLDVEVVTAREAPARPGHTAGSFVLYWNRTPQAHRLPATVDGRCTEPPRVRERVRDGA